MSRRDESRSDEIAMLIEAAVGTAWTEFKEEHPHLAAAMPVEETPARLGRRLMDDPAFVGALAEAQRAEWTLRTIQQVVERHLPELLWRLLRGR